MINLYYAYLVKYLFEYNIYFFILSMVFSMIIYYSSKVFNFQILIKNFSSSFLIKLILIISLLVSFFVNCFVFWVFIKCYYTTLNFFLYSNNIYNSPDLFYFKLPLISA
jgi:hypothetical protein